MEVRYVQDVHGNTEDSRRGSRVLGDEKKGEEAARERKGVG